MFVDVLFSECKDFGQDRRLDVPHLGGAVLGAEQLVDPTQAPSKCAVEMVFDGVVGAALTGWYRPSRHLAISVHLLPYFLCASNIMRSSRSLQGCLLMLESKWLCHLNESVSNL